MNKEEEQKRYIADMTGELSEMIEDLQAIDVKYRIDGLRHLEKYKKFPDIVPILLDHLQRGYSLPAVLFITNELISKHPAVQKAWPVIAELYDGDATSVCLKSAHKGKIDILKSQLANILIRSFANKHIEKLMGLARNPANGESRGILLEVLKRRRKNEMVHRFLVEALKDPYLKLVMSHWKPPITE